MVPEFVNFRHLVAVLRQHARAIPSDAAVKFLADGVEDGATEEGWRTYLELDTAARTLAVRLASAGAQPGDRALLLYPPGLGFLEAFLGCLYAGVVAVPTFPPRSGGRRKRLERRLQTIVEDARPGWVLASETVHRPEELETIPWLTTDQVSEEATVDPEAWREPELAPDSLAFLQYTSGSTSDPKGVQVTHGNLLHNEEMIQQVFGLSKESLVASWLPPYHDMGLIGTILQPLALGARCLLFSPGAFLRDPLLWLRTISRYRVTTSGGPNFAYDLVARRLSSEPPDLDLSCWTVAFNGAEPIHHGTLERFAQACAPYGFRRRAFLPCYGLAEATLLVSGVPWDEEPVTKTFDSASLEKHQAEPAQEGSAGRTLVSCGPPAGEQRVWVVDPESRQICPPGRIGEVWISGPSVASGYWERPEVTARDFSARLEGDQEGDGHYLRTGDLGFFHHSELFVTGRLKDLLIFRGRNHYPQDLELTASTAHAGLQPGGGAAFSVDSEGGEERLVLVLEVNRRALKTIDVDDVAAAVRRAVAREHELQVEDVVLLRPHTLPKTSSGKVQRRASRQAYLAGALRTVGSSRVATAEPGSADLSTAPNPQELETLPQEERTARVVEFLLSQLSRVVGTTVEPTESLTARGLDSLQAIELAHGVEQALGVVLPLERLLEGASARTLAEELVAEGFGGKRSSGDQALPSGAPSPGQRALWFLERLTQGTAAFLLSGAVRLDGELDGAALGRALERLIARHEALRTTFEEVDGEPRRMVREAMTLELLVEDAAAWEDNRLRLRLEELTRQPFDLHRGPLFRLGLFRRNEGSILLLVIHHLITDMWSIGIFLDELEALYREEAGGATAKLPVLVPVESREPGPEEMEHLWTFWHYRLVGAPALELPTDRSRPKVAQRTGGLWSRRLDATVGDGVRALGRRHGATVLMILLASAEALLYRLTGQDDLVIGTPTSGRDTRDVAGAMGYFVNPVVLRIDLTRNPSFEACLERTRTTALEAFAHRAMPFPWIVERLGGERTTGQSIFQVLFGFYQARRPGLGALALAVEGEPLELFSRPAEALELPRHNTQFDLTLHSTETADGGLVLAVEYDTELFDGSSARRFLGHWSTLLESALEAPSRRLSQLALLTAGEYQQIVKEAGAPVGTVPMPEVFELLERQVERTPDRPALVSTEEGEWTFRQVSERSFALEEELGTVHPGREVLVGLMLGPGPLAAVGMLGILASGAGFVPLDPRHPEARLVHMLEECAVETLVTDEATLPRARQLCESIAGLRRVVCLEPGPPPESGSTSARWARVHGDQPAYVIYTSGSTGRPKGVSLPRRHLAAILLQSRQALGFGEHTRGLQCLPFVFDFGVFEWLTTFLFGGTLHFMPRKSFADPGATARYVEEHDINTLQVTPSFFRELIAAGATFRGLETLHLGGEAVDWQDIARMEAAVGEGAVLWNDYGPTEATVFAALYKVPRQRTRKRRIRRSQVPIGRAWVGQRLYVLDGNARVVPYGVHGELCIGGYLARGYHLRPRKTAEVFVPDPFSTVPGERLYRTLDRVLRLHGGEIVFLGRFDHQVKVRGFRIELGEIEAQLRGMVEVADVVVAVRERVPGDVNLVAWIVRHKIAGEIPRPVAWREALAERLPGYMVPTAFVELESLPLGATGKLDRGALPEPRWALEADGRESVPAGEGSPLEELVAANFAQLLGVERVSPEDNFFELGGHSLLAMRLLSRLRKTFGVELSLASLFTAQTPARLVEKIEAARAEERSVGDGEPALGEFSGEPGGVLSFAQERLWFLEQVEPGTPRYNMPGALKISGALDAGALWGAARDILRRHRVLRARWREQDGQTIPVHHPEGERPAVVDLSGLAPKARQRELKRLEAREARRAFDLSRDLSPLRLRLVRLAEKEHHLVFVLHHIAGDGWSLNLFLRELAEGYRAATSGSATPAAGPRLQYDQYAQWQRAVLVGEGLESRIDGWRKSLEGVPERLEIPADRPHPIVRTSRGITRARRLSPDLSVSLQNLARRQGVTLFMVLLAAFETWLHRVTGAVDMAIGSPIANRDLPEIEDVIGLFANTLVLRGQLDGDPSFDELTRRVRSNFLAVWPVRDLPFEKVVEALQPERGWATSPLFQVMFSLNVPFEPATMPGLQTEVVELESESAKFDWSLEVTPSEEGFHTAVEASADLFDGGTVERFLGHYEVLLESIVADPERRLSELQYFSDAEFSQLLNEWSGPPDPVASAPSVPEMFRRQALRTPHGKAFVDGEGSRTYEELSVEIDALARRLVSGGESAAERPVGLMAESGPAVLVGLFAILSSGRPFVPLDPVYPVDRLQQAATECEIEVVVTERVLAEKARALGAERLLFFESEGGEAEEEGRLPETILPQQAAYILYTSGSTGKPKGVVIHHGDLAAMLVATQRFFGYDTQNRVLQTLSYAFDFGVYQFLTTLCFGGTLYFMPKGLLGDGPTTAQQLERYAAQGDAVRTLQVTPSLLRALLAAGADLRCLDLLDVGGEAMLWDDVSVARAQLRQGARMVNGYGPTEATICTTFFTIGPRVPWPGRTGVPIGRSIADHRLYVLDGWGRPVAIGVPGELYIGGQLARGYHRRPAVTAEKFLPDAWSGLAGERLYRSGDRVCFLPDGELEFLGRLDDQVKLRGYRIELGEIEAVLKRHALVKSVHIEVREDSRGISRLVAWMVVAAPIPADELRGLARRHLPEFMVPQVFLELESLPRTATGKLDTRALPDPDWETLSGTEHVAPRSPLEEVLAEIWGELLEQETVGVHDDFFALGGHSLLMTRMISQIRDELEVELTPRAVFEAPTVAGLAVALAEALLAEAGDEFSEDLLAEMAEEEVEATP